MQYPTDSSSVTHLCYPSFQDYDLHPHLGSSSEHCLFSLDDFIDFSYAFFSRGATSVVYRCEEKQTEKPYAAKVLKKTVSQLTDLVESRL